MMSARDGSAHAPECRIVRCGGIGDDGQWSRPGRDARRTTAYVGCRVRSAPSTAEHRSSQRPITEDASMRIHIRTLVAATTVALAVPASLLAQSAVPAASSPTGSPSTPDHPPFEGTHWHLREFQAEDGGTAGASDGAWLTFSDRQVTGSTGCNDLVGSYLYDGSIISIGVSEPTEASCLDGDLVGQEMSILAHLPQITSIAFEPARTEYGTNLGLVDGFGERPLVFTSLEHRQWAPMYDGEAPMPEGYTSIELRDGTLVGQGPCNAFTGPYTLDGTSIVIGPLESTRESCPDLELENELLSELQQARSYAMQAGDLVLIDEQGSTIRTYSDDRGDD
jgi:heat shock protein HslJ